MLCYLSIRLLIYSNKLLVPYGLEFFFADIFGVHLLDVIIYSPINISPIPIIPVIRVFNNNPSISVSSYFTANSIIFTRLIVFDIPCFD